MYALMGLICPAMARIVLNAYPGIGHTGQHQNFSLLIRSSKPIYLIRNCNDSCLVYSHIHLEDTGTVVILILICKSEAQKHPVGRQYACS